jgi:LacI family transcriptional regulator
VTTHRRARSESARRISAGATIREVAARAGVSVATVSRALNENGPVRAETSRRVKIAVREMKYVPHAGARSLSTQKSHTLGVLLPDVHGEFFSEVIRGIDVAARQRGYHILVSGSHSDAAEMSAVLRALRGRVDGLILMSPDTSLGPISRALGDHTPVVLLNCAAAGRSTIRVDNYSGARLMTEHLIALGHRDVAFITGPERNADAAERLRGFRDALRPLTKSSVIEVPGEFTEESGYEAMGAITRGENRPSAVFAANDSMAIGALRAAREAGLRIPEDIAIVGFDDIPIARFLTPPLTTVRVQIAEMGRRAVESVLHDSDHNSMRRRKEQVIATDLVVRESCGAANVKTKDKTSTSTTSQVTN